VSFSEALPSAYSGDWRRAERSAEDESPRFSTYQPPGGTPLKFVQDDFDFSGGQSNDTAEYPFDGLWSNRRINKKPHGITVNGRLIGKNYIEEREKFLAALFVPTDDENPGWLDLPFWGRFPVVVSEYSVGDRSREKGQCTVRLVFTRAGVSVEERAASEPSGMDAATEAAQSVAVDLFDEETRGRTNLQALFAAAGRLKAALLTVLGRIQSAQNAANSMADEINGLASLAGDVITAPRAMANTLKNAVNSIVAGLADLKNTAVSAYGRPGGGEKSAILLFMNARDFSAGPEPTTAAEQRQKAVTENLYKTMALCAVARILPTMDGLTGDEAKGLWRLYRNLESDIDQNNLGLFAALADMRGSLSRELVRLDLSSEKSRDFPSPLPLLALSANLGCPDDRLRSLNPIADSFLVGGNVIYV